MTQLTHFRDSEEILFLNDAYNTRIIYYPHFGNLKYWSKSEDGYLDGRSSCSLGGLKQKLKKDNFDIKFKWTKERINL